MLNCPKCRRPLSPGGEVTFDGRTLPVYQCDDCTEAWEFDGAIFETALTFAIDEDGNLLHPDTGQPLPPLSPSSLN